MKRMAMICRPRHRMGQAHKGKDKKHMGDMHKIGPVKPVAPPF